MGVAEFWGAATHWLIGYFPPHMFTVKANALPTPGVNVSWQIVSIMCLLGISLPLVQTILARL